MQSFRAKRIWQSVTEKTTLELWHLEKKAYVIGTIMLLSRVGRMGFCIPYED